MYEANTPLATQGLPAVPDLPVATALCGATTGADRDRSGAQAAELVETTLGVMTENTQPGRLVRGRPGH